MSGAPTSASRRWTALGLLIVLPPVLALLTLANAVSVADTNAEAALAEAQRERIERRLAGAGPAAVPRPDTAFALEAPSRSLAEADLQRRVVALSEAASVRIVESGSDGPAAEGAADILEVHATLDGDNAGLVRFLHAVETGLPLMNVSRLAVRRVTAEDADPSVDPTLRIEIVVQAPWKAVVS